MKGMAWHDNTGLKKKHDPLILLEWKKTLHLNFYPFEGDALNGSHVSFKNLLFLSMWHFQGYVTQVLPLHKSELLYKQNRYNISTIFFPSIGLENSTKLDLSFVCQILENVNKS